MLSLKNDLFRIPNAVSPTFGLAIGLVGVCLPLLFSIETYYQDTEDIFRESFSYLTDVEKDRAY